MYAIRSYYGFLEDEVLQESMLMGECIVHLHGLWSPTVHLAARFARRNRLPYVVSIRGMLAGWALAHKGRKKKLAWRLYQKADLIAADCLLASSEFEKSDVASLLPGKEIAVIPNGCDERPEVTEKRQA